MGHESSLLVALDLTGTFAFALNGALTAVNGCRRHSAEPATTTAATVLSAA